MQQKQGRNPTMTNNRSQLNWQTTRRLPGQFSREMQKPIEQLRRKMPEQRLMVATIGAEPIVIGELVFYAFSVSISSNINRSLSMRLAV